MSAAHIKSQLTGIAGRSDMPGTVRLRIRFLAALLIATSLSPIRCEPPMWRHTSIPT